MTNQIIRRSDHSHKLMVLGKSLNHGLAVGRATFSLLPQFAFAEGNTLIDQDPKATARGEAFAATANNPSAPGATPC